MADFNVWLQEVERHIREFKSVLLPVDRLEVVVADLLKQPECPFSGIRLEISPRAPFSAVEVGLALEHKPAEVRSIGNQDSFGTDATISLWTRPGGNRPSPAEMTTVFDALGRLVAAFWKGDLRDAISWLISKQNSERQQLIENTLRQTRPSDFPTTVRLMRTSSSASASAKES